MPPPPARSTCSSSPSPEVLAGAGGHRQVDREALAWPAADVLQRRRCRGRSLPGGCWRRARRRGGERSPPCRCRGGRPSRRSSPARRPSSRSASSAATATLSKRQKPIARSRSAWWPGGRVTAEADHVLAAEQRPHHRAGAARRRAAPPPRRPRPRRCRDRSRRRRSAHRPRIRSTCAAAVHQLQLAPHSRPAPRAAPSRASRARRAPARSPAGARVVPGCQGITGAGSWSRQAGWLK